MSDIYETELEQDILKKNGIFARRSGGSEVIDVIALYKMKGIIFEVKSSQDKTVYLSGNRLKGQFEGYGDLMNEFDVKVIYALRWKSGKHWDKINNWRIYEYNNVEFTKRGNPVLHWEEGKPMEEWIKYFKD